MNYENQEHYEHCMNMQAEAEYEQYQSEFDAKAELDRITYEHECYERECAEKEIENLNNKIEMYQEKINELKEEIANIISHIF